MTDPVEVPNTATALKNMFLSITLDGVGATESDNFAGHVSSVTCTPNVSTVNWSGGTPASQKSDSIGQGHTLAVNVGQDLENVDSLAVFLLQHVGEGATFKWRPQLGGTFEISVHVPTIPELVVGGSVNQFNESTLSMASDAPEYTFPS